MSLFAELKRRNVIRIVVAYLAGAWLLIQIADTVFPAYGLPDPAMAVLITLLIIGLVPTAIISWVFELTPEGFKRDTDVLPGESLAPRTARQLDRIIMIVLALGIVYFAIDKFVLEPVRDAELVEQVAEQTRVEALIESYGDKSIAVLPFADLSPGGDQAWFADGIAEELLNLLASIRQLRVISRSSAFSFRGDDIHIPHVSEALNVAYVLEGSVRAAGDRLRITAQLIDGKTDTHVWSETYDRELGDVFDIQDAIAGAIVDELKLELLGPRSPAQRTDPETYALYLRARHIFNSKVGDADDLQREAELLRNVLDRDPEFVPAMTLLTTIYWYQTGAVYSIDEGDRLRSELWRKAHALAPNDPVVVAQGAWRALEIEHDAAKAARWVERALKFGGNDSEVLRIASFVASVLGQYDVAVTLIVRAVARDPLCAQCYSQLGAAYMTAGMFDEAEATIRRRIELFDDIGAQFNLGYLYTAMGDYARALAVFDELKELEGHELFAQVERAKLLHHLGRVEEFRLLIQQLEAEAGERFAVNIGMIYAEIGDADAAFRWFDKNPAVFERYFPFNAWSPRLQAIFDDPRWQAMREETGLTEAAISAATIRIPE